MATGLHKNLAAAEIHAPASYEYADAAARTGATGFVAGDVGRLARQLDDNTLWLLTATTPTWAQVATGGPAITLTSSAPVNVTKSAAVVGVATDAARADHKHDVTTAAPSTVGTANAEGASTSLARADHVHSHGNQAGGGLHADVISGGASGFISGVDKAKLDTVEPFATSTPLTAVAPVDVTKATAAVGAAITAARADHKHDISTAAPADIGTANAEGTAASLARSDHTHNLPFTPVQTALGAATGSISINSQKITNALDPTAAQDVATKAYVDASVPAASGQPVLHWGNQNVGTSTTARFLSPGYDSNTAPTTTIQWRVPRAGAISKLYVHHNTVGVGAVNVTYTVRKNGAAQALTCTMLATAADASDLTNSFAVAAGDLVDITVTKAGTLTTSPANVMASVQFA